MARGRLEDHLQTFKFHLLDVSVVIGGIVPVPVFNPVLGFSSITAPEMSAEVETIEEGNNEFPRKVVKGGTVETISCQRGATFFDADFWRWLIACIKGGGMNSRRKTLLLVHLMNKSVFGIEGALLGGGVATAAGIGAAARFTIPETTAIEAGLIGVGTVIGLIPARAWLMQNCIATRLKSGSDFDASSGAVSIQELDFECEFFEEFSLGS